MFSLKQPATVGSKIGCVETPCLLVCLNRLEGNIRRMKEYMEKYPGVSYRPHAKAHKSPIIGQMQIDGGASGLCCQTLTEAEAMVEGGIKDVLLSNQVIGSSKLLRLAGLAKRARVSVCVDDERNIEAVSQAANEMGTSLDLVVEVNVGQDRCGVEPGDDVVRLVKKIQNSENVSFKGLQCYNGWNQHIRRISERKAAVDAVIEKSKKALKALQDSGIECNYVTGGGTGTFHFEADSGVFTEVQPGSYIWMDVDYSKNLGDGDAPCAEFKQSLYVLSTVQSVSSNRAVIDAGLKAVSLDSGVPLLSHMEDLVFSNGGDEHGIVKPKGDLKIGDQVWLVPGHCDPTVNMHSWLVGMRSGHVESVWPISGRGPGV